MMNKQFQFDDRLELVDFARFASARADVMLARWGYK